MCPSSALCALSTIFRVPFLYRLQPAGVMAKSGLWFDLPNSPYAVGYGIINGRHGITIVSVPR